MSVEGRNSSSNFENGEFKAYSQAARIARNIPCFVFSIDKCIEKTQCLIANKVFDIILENTGNGHNNQNGEFVR